MNIEKVVKAYFIFVMAIVSIGVLSYNDSFDRYFLSVFHSNGVESDGDISSSLFASSISYRGNGDEFSVSGRQNVVSLNIEENLNSFVQPGSEGATIMKFVFVAEEDVVLEDLKLKIVEIDPKYLVRAVLMDGNEVLEEGKISGGYCVFSGVDYEIKKGFKSSLSLVIDLSPDVKTGQRLRMDIETAEDLGLVAHGRSVKIGKHYPIKGSYLSVAKPRQSSP